MTTRCEKDEASMEGLTQTRDVMNVREAADFLRISEGTLRDLIRAGEVPFLKIGTRILFARSSLLKWVDQLSTHPGTPPTLKGGEAKVQDILRSSKGR